MQTDVLLCRSPELVAKEVWAQLLAYDIVRGLMTRRGGARGAAAGVELHGGVAGPDRLP
jgi:hypothetical protein